jgi:hypothetical protein
MEFKISSVCVSPGFCSTGGRDPCSWQRQAGQGRFPPRHVLLLSFAECLLQACCSTFLPTSFPFALSLLVLTSTGLSYLTRLWRGGIILRSLLPFLLGWALQRLAWQDRFVKYGLATT